MSQKPSKNYRTLVLLLLTLVYGFNFIDRQIVGILAPFIQADLGLSNSQLGLLIGFAFAVLYTVVGIPIALMADKFNRVNILAISLALWSGFTALTGMANNFVQIGLARMGVGIGEAGGSPPSHSIISDLYPKEERASALGVYSLGIPLGIMTAYFATASLMGANPETVNWRRIFIVLGVIGIALAIVVRLILREPVRGTQEIAKGGEVKKYRFSQNLKTLLSIKSWWFMCLGIATASFASYAFSGFQTKFIRLLDPSYDFRQVVLILGVINGIAYAGGTFIGAKIADRWGAKNVRAYGWVPAISIGIVLPFAVMGFWVDSVNLHLITTFFMLSFLGVYLGPSFAIAQTLAPIHMRAMSTALFFFILNMIALGGGPTTAGLLIDVFKSAGHDDLMATKYAMTCVSFAFFVGVCFFLLVSKTLPKDWAAAEARNEGRGT
ncbi:MAG: spinster family MFS transporter [Alphaproteobacteria bacterium]